MWCVAKLDESYIERMEDLLRLYAKPLNKREPVVCFDEKSVQLKEDLFPRQLPRPGRYARRDHEYIRRGTANVFCVIEPKTGKYLLKTTQRRTAIDFAEALRNIAQRYPKAKKIHLVLDNLNTHGLKSVIKRYGLSTATRLWNRFKFHFTPKHASWLNQAEIAISNFSKKVLFRARYSSLQALQSATSAFQKKQNAQPSPISWRFTVKDARRKFKYETH